MKNTETNLDDIIFENRNKDYGAYTLRKNYNRNMMSAVVIAVVIFLLGVSIPLLAGYFNKVNVGPGGDKISVVIDHPPKNTTITPPPKPPADKKINKAYKPPIVINTDEDLPELSDLMDKAVNARPADTFASVDIPEDKPTTNVIDEGEELKIHTFVEEWPEYTGGDAARVKFLNENIKYPKMAKETGIQGPVYLTFVVERDCNISSVAVLRGIGGGCDEEAARVVSSMPKWKPGRQNGKEVRVQYNMPINFKLI